MDINDAIIITCKFIVTYYCLSACSVHRYRSLLCMRAESLKPCLLLSNPCHVEYFDLALSLSLNSWLNKSRVLFVILEGNLRSGLTSVAKSILSAESAQSHRQATITMARLIKVQYWHCQSFSQNPFLELHSSSSARPGMQVLSYLLSINTVINSSYLWLC